MDIHNVSQHRIIGIHQQVLYRDNTFQPSLFIHYIAGIDRFLIHTVFPYIGKCLFHSHLLFKPDIFCRHNASGAVLRIVQKLVNQLSGVGT